MSPYPPYRGWQEARVLCRRTVDDEARALDLADMQASLDAAHREAVEEALDRPLLATVLVEQGGNLCTVTRDVSPMKPRHSPAPNWRSNCGAQH